MAAQEQDSAVSEQAAQETQGTLLVIDGHSLAFRAFFAFPEESFSNQAGQATNAVYGFATMLAQVVAHERPTRLAVAFDLPGGTFRNELLPQYKGTRDAAPTTLLSQLPIIQDLLGNLGVTCVEKPGFEGDDVIGTLATMGAQAKYRTLVLSGDRDAFQLIDEYVTVLYPARHFKDLQRMDADAVYAKYQVTPQQYPDLAALRGETADNIPGVPGVGDGFAAKWLQAYGSLQGVVEHADAITGKKGQALRDNIDQVLLNRRVNALVRDLDLGVTLDDLTFGAVDAAALNQQFDQLNFGQGTRARIMRALSGGNAGNTGRVSNAVGVERASRDGSTSGADNAGYVASNRAASNAVSSAASSSLTNGERTQGAWQNALGNASRERDVQEDASTMTLAAAQPLVLDGIVASSADEAALNAWLIAQGLLSAQQSEESSWVLYAAGDARPGNSSLQGVVLAAGQHALAIAAPVSEGVRTLLQQALDASSSRAVVYGYKELLHLLVTQRLAVAQPHIDVKLAAYLLEPDARIESLEQTATQFLGAAQGVDEQQVQGELEGIAEAALPINAEGAGAEDVGALQQTAESETQAIIQAQCEQWLQAAQQVRDLGAVLAAQLTRRNQWDLLRDIELPVSAVLYRMEACGAAIDAQRLQSMREQFAAEAQQAQQVAFDAAGQDSINLQSPKQLQKVLFEDFGLRSTRKTKSGGYTTNAAALQDLYLHTVENERANTFLGALLRHREINKLKQIVQTLLDSVSAADGKIHTTYEQTVAATGRLSSADPNLQNIPNRNAMGREIRSVFVPSEGFESLLSCDYSQVELRLMADMSGDEALIAAFQSGADFHKYVASLVYKVPVEQISADQRTHVKAMSYGLAYGLSTYGLAQQLGISPAAADVLKNEYFATFGKVHDFLESLVESARRNGYTQTMFGRRRYFPGLHSRNRVARDAAERGALNAPIQGSAADIMKIAMIKAEAALAKEKLKSRIILQIHDELVVEVAPGEREAVTRAVGDAMRHAVHLAVPLDVSIGVGADWQLAAH